MDQAVNFNFIVKLIDKYWRSILISTVTGLGLATIFTFFVTTPKYESAVQILVSRHSEGAATQFTNQQADVQMITTYKELITNSVILNPVRKALKEKYDYTYSVDQLKNSISVSSTQNSQVFSILVTNPNSVRSAEIANQIAEDFKKQVKKIIKVNNVTIVAPATPGKSPVSPNKLVNLLVGIMAGLGIGFVIATLRTLTDRRVQSIEFLVDDLSLVILGQVNHQYHHHHQESQIESIENNSKYNAGKGGSESLSRRV